MRFKSGLWKMAVFCLLAASLLGGCAGTDSGSSGSRAGETAESAGGAAQSAAEQAVTEGAAEGGAAAAAREEDGNGEHLRDVGLLYEGQDPSQVVTMYLTVSSGNEADNTNHTWEEVNTYSAYDYDEWGVDRYKVNALLQVGDENGPLEGELGYGQEVPNATVQIRGQTSSRYSQKNYKIKLRDEKGLWRGQQTIALNKHQQDGLRFRNKLGFDLMAQIPQIMSLRTQFVHLYVKDLTGENPESAKFEDYGLYTQVEQPNKKFLRAHGLDRNGYLYKINEMEFYRYEDVIVPVTDPAYDEAAFSRLLECKGRADHTRLIDMLEAVNDDTVSGQDLLDTYFDSENIAYWMAFMILTGNADTENRNFYLYSPLNGSRWYILPWDNDAALMRTENALRDYTDAESWQQGISNYWGNMLFRKLLMSAAFREELERAMQDLMAGALSEENMAAMVSERAKVAEPYVYRQPDIGYAPLTREDYETTAAALAGEIRQNYDAYRLTLEQPMPFFVGVPEPEGDHLQLYWDVSYDFDAEDVRYDVTLARDYLFEDVVFSQEGVRMNETECPLPEPGQYFLRVRAKNESGCSQDSFDYYVTAENGKAYGALCFYVNDDGTVMLDDAAQE